MLQQQARTVLTELRNDIARSGYDSSEKRHLAVLFGDLKLRYSNPAPKAGLVTDAAATAAAEKLKAVSELEQTWQKDRRNDSGGADSILGILDKVEQFIGDLEAVYKDPTIVVPSLQEQEADRLLATLQQRGMKLVPANA